MKKIKNILIALANLTFLGINAQNVELTKSFVGNSEKSEIISFTPQDEILLSGDFSGYINYWDIPNEALISSTKAHFGKINRIEFSENGEHFLTFSTDDKQVKIWNFSGQDTLVNFYIKNTPHFAIFYDQNSALIGDENGTIYHKDFYESENDSIIYKNSTRVIDAVFNKIKNELIITTKNKIKIIDLNNQNKTRFSIENSYSSNFVKTQYYSPEILMTWSQNGIVSFWDINKKKMIRELRAKNNFHELSINQYSKVLLTGYYKDKALLFDLQNIDLEQELDENIQLVNTYLTNDYNRFMISSSEEGRHRLMRVKGGDAIKPLSLQKRTIEIQKVITVESKILRLAVWDNERVDGDKISLSLNGKWIIRNYEIIKDKRHFEIELVKGQVNQLVFFAENLGRIPPNTSAINIQYDGYNKTHIMRSNMEKSGSINFYLEEK
ncbi:MAG: WD40 repeat domain-containing protein [Flavobacteriales bacterium]|nr:WD40 repeat domain-containing protein [Flavobacteriales bacterium]